MSDQRLATNQETEKAQLGWQNDIKVDVPEQEGTTHMENVNEVDIISRQEPKVPDSRYLAGANTGYIQGLQEFLKKPVQFANGVFSSSDAMGNSAWAINLDVPTLFSNNSSIGASVWGNKVSGFLGIRATIRVHLIVNAQPFQQGRYFLMFEPCKGDMAQPFIRNNYMTIMTQLPRAEVDLCSQSEVVMDIPYIHLNTHLNLLSNEGSWGRLYINCYIPFATGTGGTQSAPYQMYFSLHDVDLVCPTKPITVAQMAVPDLKRKGKVQEEKIEEGPISSFLNKVSTATMYMAEIPLLTSYLMPISWCTSLMSKSAAAFGWSKPRNELVVQRMNNLMGQYQQNCDGVENAYSLGLFNTNKVQVMPSLGGTNIDEMSIDFIKQQPAYISQGSWSTTTTAGTQLNSYNLAPLNQSITGLGTSGNGVVLTPVAGIANCFQYYRGSLILTFKFAKTKFHTGRLLICFSPGNDSTDAYGNKSQTPITSITTTNYLHREFVDIQDCCEFELNVPYVSLQPYNLVSNSYGRVHVFVLNPLQCPATCNSSISYVVEVRGAPDLEFFQPSPPVYFPSTAYAQSDPEAMPRKKLNLGMAQTYKDNMPAQLCVGEKVTSIKQLVSRGFWSDAPTTLASFRPFAIGILPKAASAPYSPCDYYSYFASIFVFSRGGMIIRSSSPSAGAWCLSLDIDPSNAMSQSYVRDIHMTNCVESDSSKFNSVYVPQYTLTHGRLNCPDAGGALGAKPSFRSNSIVRKSTLSNSTTAPSLYIMRSGADDTQFGYFVGFPAMTQRPKMDFA